MRLLLLCLPVFLLVMFSIGLAQETSSEITYILDIAWSPDGNRLATVGIHPGFAPSADGSVQNAGYSPELNTHGYLSVIDGRSGNTLFTVEPASAFTSVAWSPDGQQIALGSFDTTIWIVNASTGERITNLFGHQATVTDVDWNRAGTQIISTGDWDELVILWDATNYAPIAQFETVGSPRTIEFNPDDQTVALGTERGVFVFPPDIPTNTRIWSDYVTIRDRVSSVAYSHDGRYLAVGTTTFRSDITGERDNAPTYILDTSTQAIVHRFESSLGSITGLSWDVDNQSLAVVSEDNVLSIWNVETEGVFATYSTGGIDQSRDGVAYSAYGGRLAFSNWLNPVPSTVEPPGSAREDRTVFGNGTVQIVVPSPSPEQLQAIADACGASASIEHSLTISIQADQFAELMTQVEALPEDTIPPACAADLIAVAEALQSRS